VSDTIVVGGAIARQPGRAGHAWMYLQYLLGFRRLGFEVLFVDWLESPPDCAGVEYLRAVMDQFGLADRWTLLCEGDAIGMPLRELLDRATGAVCLLNFMGYVVDEDVLAAPDKRVLLDIDPGVGQMWHELGMADIFAGHDVHVTIGERIRAPDCSIPACGIDWVTSRQPVVLDEWPRTNGGGRRFTSVGAWRGPFAPIEFQGETYGQRVHEFRKFVELPRRVRAEFELALAIDTDDEADRLLLEEHGWRLVEPAVAAGTPDAYRHFVQRSSAELLVAKGMPVKTRSGWFSDRSVCYLASGKPVLAEDTGLEELYPVGEGLLTFSTLEEAVGGVEEILRNYARHAAAARQLAVEYFDSDKVLPRLVEAVG
jgi:hypothetical protein